MSALFRIAFVVVLCIFAVALANPSPDGAHAHEHAHAAKRSANPSPDGAHAHEHAHAAKRSADEGIAGSGDEYADIGEEYEAGDYEEPPDPVDNDIEYEAPAEEIEEEPEITTSRPSLISIPLVIEEKDEDVLATGNQGGDPTVILAGTAEVRRPDTLYGGPIDGYEDEDALRK